jgi:hypothetical protein
MFTDKFIQPGNSCGAATLAIAAKQLGKPVAVDIPTVNTLYAKTWDDVLSKSLGKTNQQDYYSTPGNIITTAKGLGLTATLYTKKDISSSALPPQIVGFKTHYVDGLTPPPVAIDTAGLKGLLTSKTYLQLLVYLDGKKDAMHWVLLQTDGSGNYNLYDTAYGTNKPLTSTDVDNLLAFDAPVTTGRLNNFYGIAILLQ